MHSHRKYHFSGGLQTKKPLQTFDPPALHQVWVEVASSCCAVPFLMTSRSQICVLFFVTRIISGAAKSCRLLYIELRYRTTYTVLVLRVAIFGGGKLPDMIFNFPVREVYRKSRRPS